MMPAGENSKSCLPYAGSSSVVVIAAVLALITLAVYMPARSNNFISFDDDSYITENPHIKDGITLNALKWAFTEHYSYNYHPLTWVTHMVDVSLYGLKPQGHHLTNVFFHVINVVIVFLTLTYLTNRPRAALIVSALFALAPVNVETVAWVSERKNLLSTSFWFLTILSYAYYVKLGGSLRYTLTVMCFLLGLLSKAMLVTLPFVLLLLDFWPLQRFATKNMIQLSIEKLPLLGLSLVFIFVTIFTQTTGGNVVPLSVLPFDIRLENAALSYIRYLGKIFWPSNFSIFYPYVISKSVVPAICAACVVIFITVFSIIKRQSYPWLFTGWLWFTVTLIPVIQIVQTGWASMADRYAYVPQIGIFITLSWSLTVVLEERIFLQKLSVLVFAAILCFLYITTSMQLKHWKDSESLYLHAMQVTDNNYVAYGEYGLCLMNKGKVKESIPYFMRALEILPGSPTLNYYTWKAYITSGNVKEASGYFLKASPLIRVENTPSIAKMLGISLLKNKKYGDAYASFLEALRFAPADTGIYEGLAQALIGLNNPTEALLYIEQGLQLKHDAPVLLKLRGEISETMLSETKK